MIGIGYRPGMNWPRNPHPDPSVARERLRSRLSPFRPGDLGR